MSGQNGQANQGNVQVDPTYVIDSLKRQLAEAAARTGEEVAMRDALIEQLSAEVTKLREVLDRSASTVAGASQAERTRSSHRADPATVDVP